MKLKEFKRLFADNMKLYWEEIGKAQYLAKELAIYLDRVKRNQEPPPYEKMLGSPVPAPLNMKQVEWRSTDPNPMASWCLVPKEKLASDSQSSASQPSSGGERKGVVDSRKSIAWFNQEYEEEHSWDLEVVPPKEKQEDEQEDGKGEQELLHRLEDKLREEQMIRNQVERLLEEEKARASLEVAKWKSELVAAQQHIEMLTNEKDLLTSDLTMKTERLHSLNKNLMEKASSSSSASANGHRAEEQSWEEMQFQPPSQEDDEPVSLRRLTMGVGLLRRIDGATQGTGALSTETL